MDYTWFKNIKEKKEITTRKLQCSQNVFSCKYTHGNVSMHIDIWKPFFPRIMTNYCEQPFDTLWYSSLLHALYVSSHGDHLMAAFWNKIFLLLSFCRWENSCLERVSEFLKVSEDLSDGAKRDTPLVKIQNLFNLDIH